MAVAIPGPRTQVLVEAEALNKASFATFGAVIENPAPTLTPSPGITSLPANAVQANQGTALKYLNVTDMEDLYASASSKKPSKAVMNMFVCAPRSLLASSKHGVKGYFPVKILERHPYTTQTFIPLGISIGQAHLARYLVIVAPSLPPANKDQHFSVPSTTVGKGPLPGRGLPDLQRIKVFVANGGQAVTYGAGTWHAPMVVLGSKPIDFVVVQFANGVASEDCQEAELSADVQNKLLAVVPVHSKTPSKL